MTIVLTKEQLDSQEEPLTFQCNACGVDSEIFRQGECTSKLFHVTIDPNVRAGKFTDTRVDINVDLCRLHLRFLRPYVTWGALFCECGGIVEATGETQPIENSDGVWEELKCEHFDNVITFSEHYHEWEPID